MRASPSIWLNPSTLLLKEICGIMSAQTAPPGSILNFLKSTGRFFPKMTATISGYSPITTQSELTVLLAITCGRSSLARGVPSFQIEEVRDL